MSWSAGEAVRLSVKARSVKLEAREGSDVFEPVHRIFFTNVLGFELDADAPAYVLAESDSLAAITLESLEYLNSTGVPVVLNDAAAEIAERARIDKTELRRSKRIGADLKQSPITSVSVPGLRRPLKTYQVPAVAHLTSVAHGANFSVPGSGKTAIALAAFAILRAEGAVEKLIVIGPRSSFMPWEEEAAATLSEALQPLRIVGARRARTRLYRNADKADLLLLTYQMASNDARDLERMLRDHRVMLVLDESHNIKRIEGGKWADTLIGLAPLAAKRVILTGTPVPNSITDLWSQFEFLWPQNSPLGGRDDFRYRAKLSDEATIEASRAAIAPLYWRVRKEELGLPPPVYHTIPIPMSKYQQAIYNVIAAKVLADVVKAPEQRDKLRLWRRARMVRLLQAASNPALLAQYSQEFRVPPMDASGLPVDRIIEKYSDFEMPKKLQVVETLTRTLVTQGRQVLIWTTFIHNLLTLERQLADLGPATLYGAIPRDAEEDESINREVIINAFKQGKHRVLIANPSACAESISLHTVCRDAIYLDRTFNAAHYLQSLNRIHRVGLGPRDEVRYYILQSTESIDDIIAQRLEEKISRMVRLLNEEVDVLDLDSPEDRFSEEGEEDADFAALLEALKSQVP